MVESKTLPLISPSAIWRTVTVSVWVPALPPIEATIGIRMARATSDCRVASKRPMTIDAAMAVIRLMPSQKARCFPIWKRELTVSEIMSPVLPRSSYTVLPR